MAVLQSAYTALIPDLFPGQVFNGETSNRISRTIEDAVAVPFGTALFFGVGDHGATATPTAGKLYGFNILNDAGVAASVGANANPGVGQYSTAGIMTKGVMGALASIAVTKGDQVYVVPGTFVLTNVASGNIICPNWFFDKTITAAGNTRIANRA